MDFEPLSRAQLQQSGGDVSQNGEGGTFLSIIKFSDLSEDVAEHSAVSRFQGVVTH